MKPLPIISEHDATYFAGFFDGEGSIGIYNNVKSPDRINRSMTLRLGVTNTNHAVMKWMSTHLAGNSKPRAAHSGQRPYWVWQVHSRQAAHVLRAILPHLICKRAEALVALEFAALTEVSLRRPRLKGRRGNIPLSTEEVAQRYALAQRLRTLKKPNPTPHS